MPHSSVLIILYIVHERFFENLMMKQNETQVKGTAFEGSAEMIRDRLARVGDPFPSSSSSSSKSNQDNDVSVRRATQKVSTKDIAKFDRPLGSESSRTARLGVDNPDRYSRPFSSPTWASRRINKSLMQLQKVFINFIAASD